MPAGKTVSNKTVQRTMAPGRLPIGMRERALELDLIGGSIEVESSAPVGADIGSDFQIIEIEPKWDSWAIAATYDSLDTTNELPHSVLVIRTHGFKWLRLTVSCDATGGGTLLLKRYNGSSFVNAGQWMTYVVLTPGPETASVGLYVPLSAAEMNTEVQYRVYLSGDDAVDTDPINIQLQMLGPGKRYYGPKSQPTDPIAPTEPAPEDLPVITDPEEDDATEGISDEG